MREVARKVRPVRTKPNSIFYEVQGAKYGGKEVRGESSISRRDFIKVDPPTRDHSTLTTQIGQKAFVLVPVPWLDSSIRPGMYAIQKQALGTSCGGSSLATQVEPGTVARRTRSVEDEVSRGEGKETAIRCSAVMAREIEVEKTEIGRCMM